MTQTSDTLLRLQDVSKRFGKKTALDHISLEIAPGRMVGLLGSNGSGKSTLIKLINGLLVPSSGQIFICGQAPGPETKAIVSYLPERTYLPDTVRVKGLLSFFRDFYTDFDAAKAEEMLQKLDIAPSSPLKTLSKGTREKVQLIMVMSRRARVYILDEPIAGVDPAARDYILKTIIQDYNEDASILLSTHLIADVEQLLDDVIFLKDGQIILSSSVLYELVGPGCAKLSLYLSGSYSTRLEDLADVTAETASGETKTPVQLLTERIAKIQSELPQRAASLSEEESAFLEAAEEQLLAAQRPQRRSPFFRR